LKLVFIRISPLELNFSNTLGFLNPILANLCPKIMPSPKFDTVVLLDNDPFSILKKAISIDGSQYSFTTCADLLILASGK
jgi:hypothetical protein